VDATRRQFAHERDVLAMDRYDDWAQATTAMGLPE
jgi:hypothetical protein